MSQDLRNLRAKKWRENREFWNFLQTSQVSLFFENFCKTFLQISENSANLDANFPIFSRKFLRSLLISILSLLTQLRCLQQIYVFKPVYL